MYSTQESLILASASPRRKELLAQIGLRFAVEVAEINEDPLVGELPEGYVMRLAREKAQEVAQAHPESWVIGADTIVCIDQQLLGKPSDEGEAVATLMKLSGKCHRVVTAFSLINKAKSRCEVEAVSTEVYFREFTKDVALNYVATGEPLDKAGSYGIQGLGAALVDRIEGSYSSVVGLPVAQVVVCLEKCGVIRSCR